MNVSLFGLGLVGCVTAACLARDGHRIIGVDRNLRRVEMINAGKSPALEPFLDTLIMQGRQRGLLEATDDPGYALHESEISLLCVGSPAKENGQIDTFQIEQACRDLAPTLRMLPRHHTIVIRSTVVPGTTERLLIPLLEEATGLSAGKDFAVCVNPEFLREGTAVADFDSPPYTIVGQNSERDGLLVRRLFAGVPVPLFPVSLRMAEMIKYANNAFHALKVAFANEIGALSQTMGLDGRELMDLLCADTKLNLSDYYLRPGAPFGGACLSKDLEAVLFHGQQLGLRSPLLEAILPSNEQHQERILGQVRKTARRNVTFLGLTAKQGSGDLRGSAFVAMIRELLKSGYVVRAFDEDIPWDSVRFPDPGIFPDGLGPLIQEVLAPSLQESIHLAEVIIRTKPLSLPREQEFLALLRPEQTVIELAHQRGEERSQPWGRRTRFVR